MSSNFEKLILSGASSTTISPNVDMDLTEFVTKITNAVLNYSEEECLPACLVFYGSNAEESYEIAEELIEDFLDENPGIRVKLARNTQEVINSLYDRCVAVGVGSQERVTQAIIQERGAFLGILDPLCPDMDKHGWVAKFNRRGVTAPRLEVVHGVMDRVSEVGTDLERQHSHDMINPLAEAGESYD